MDNFTLEMKVRGVFVPVGDDFKSAEEAENCIFNCLYDYRVINNNTNEVVNYIKKQYASRRQAI